MTPTYGDSDQVRFVEGDGFHALRKRRKIAAALAAEALRCNSIRVSSENWDEVTHRKMAVSDLLPTSRSAIANLILGDPRTSKGPISSNSLGSLLPRLKDDLFGVGRRAVVLLAGCKRSRIRAGL
jgi:hypothetical protein